MTETSLIAHEFAWYRRDEVVKAVQRLQKRAAKLGVAFSAQISVLPTREQPEMVRDPLLPEGDNWVPSGRVEQWGTVSFDVAEVKLPGWTLVGVLTPMPVSETGNEVVLYPTAVPGQTLPEDVRTWVARCDHCQAIRDRKETFVLRHDDGSVKQVGRQCIRDFLGHDADRMLARYNFLQIVSSFGDEEGFGSGGFNPDAPMRLDYLLALTSAVIRAKGWMSAKRAREIAASEGNEYRVIPTTRGYVDVLLNGRYDDRDVRDLRKEVGPVTDEDRAAAEVARNFWLEDKGNSDYSANAKLLASAGLVIKRAMGLAVSMLPVAQSAIQKRAAQAAEEARGEKVVSKHVGTIGKREIFEVEVIGHRLFESDFGTKALWTLRTRDGNLIKWWATGNDAFLPEQPNTGVFVKVKGTVKQHGQYNGKLETTINRVVEA